MTTRHFRLLCGAILIALPTLFAGCTQERVVSDDPAEIEKQRQAHIEMTEREQRER